MKFDQKYWVLLLVVFFSCSTEVPEQNLSPIRSISLNTSTYQMLSYQLDNTGKYLFIYGNTQDGGNELSNVVKIDVNSLKIVKQSVLSGKHKFIGANNVRFNNQNQMICDQRGSSFSEDLVVLCNNDLDELGSVNIPGGNDRSRRRIAINKQNQILVAHSYKDPNPNIDGGALLNYYLFDNNLNVLTTTQDQSLYDQEYLIGSELIGLNDGGSLFVSRLVNSPSYNYEVLVEKRDANLNLVWRNILKAPGNQFGFSTIEHNNKIYISGYGVDPDDNFENKLLIYELDLQGNLLKTKFIDNGSILSKLIEPIAATEDGGFLISGVTSKNTSLLFQKGVIFKLDGDLNVQKSLVYGSNGSVSSAGFIKVSENRYLLFYLDNGFAPDGSSFRLVFQYFDQKLNILDQ